MTSEEIEEFVRETIYDFNDPLYPFLEGYKLEHAIRKGLAKGLAEGGIKWHDLREDSSDLPKVKGRYLVCTQNAQESTISYFNHSEMEFIDNEVIAWADLPKRGRS